MRPNMKKYAWGAAFAAGLLAGCGGSAYKTADQYPPEHPPRVEAPDARSPGQYNEDASISSRVQTAVLAVPGMYPQGLEVSTYEGVVTLRGYAGNETAARNAVQAARQVTGVRSVDYDVQVQPYHPPHQQPYQQPYTPSQQQPYQPQYQVVPQQPMR